MSIDYNKCAYLNADKQNASSMLKPCINGADPLVWPCDERKVMNNDILSLVTERPNGDNIEGELPHSLNVSPELQARRKLLNSVAPPEKKANENMYGNSNIEGFTNLGASYVREGGLPDTYYKCPLTGKITKLCDNCKYNQDKVGLSRQFNEGDPCFPYGVYNGLDNDGYTQCTCGSEGQYCNEIFDVQGGLFADGVYLMNVGDFGVVADYTAY